MKRRFNLVELCVVVAIMAVLLSLLSPSLSRMVDKSRALVCIKHQSNYFRSFELFAEDNSTYPFASHGGQYKDTELHGIRWYDMLEVYLSEEFERRCPGWSPEIKDSFTKVKGTNGLYTSTDDDLDYAMNQYLNNTGRHIYKRPEMVIVPSQTSLLIDWPAHVIQQSHIEVGIPIVSQQHDMINVLYIDGHASSHIPDPNWTWNRFVAPTNLWQRFYLGN